MIEKVCFYPAMRNILLQLPQMDNSEIIIVTYFYNIPKKLSLGNNRIQNN